MEQNNDKHPYEVLFLNKDTEGNKQFIADLGVYTKNRMMRIYDSTKFGKPRETALQLKNCSEKGTAFEKLLFFNSLISNVFVDDETRILSFDKVAETTLASALFIVSDLPTKRHRFQLTTSSSQGTMIDDLFQDYVFKFDGLRKFLATKCNEGGSQGFTGKGKFNPQKNTILFPIEGNRYCSNINRQHKSNGTYFVVFLSSGTFQRRCHDVDCQVYAIPSIKIPNDVLEETNEEIIEYHMVRIDSEATNAKRLKE